MKILKATFFALAILLAGVCTADAQGAKKDKKTAKETEVKNTLESRNYTFTAQNVSPMRGSTRQLTSEYDLRVTKDSVIAYLPYFGRAYVATMDPNEAGIKFTSTRFSYVSTAKKSGYEIVIKPADTKDVRQMILSVSVNGYATLSVTNLNRDPISFYGMVQANKKAK